MQNPTEMSAALRAPVTPVAAPQPVQPVQAPVSMPVAGTPDPFTQGGFGTDGFGMGQYAAPPPMDRDFTGGAMSDMGATALGGGGTGNGQIIRDQEAAVVAAEQRRIEAQKAAARAANAPPSSGVDSNAGGR